MVVASHDEIGLSGRRASSHFERICDIFFRLIEFCSEDASGFPEDRQ